MDKQFSQFEFGVSDKLFNSEDVKAVAGINEVTLQNWLARGRLKLDQQNPGRGKSRRYTLYEVARIRFLKRFADLGLPLKPAFKITAALKKLWEATPGGHEGYSRERKSASWVLIARAELWNRQVAIRRFPLHHSPVEADGYVAIWAAEMIGDAKRSLREAINFFVGGPLIVVNMGVLLDETVSLLKRRLMERDG
jgi:DNA-binding transcriptional MerR regulator